MLVVEFLRDQIIALAMKRYARPHFFVWYVIFLPLLFFTSQSFSQEIVSYRGYEFCEELAQVGGQEISDLSSYAQQFNSCVQCELQDQGHPELNTSIIRHAKYELCMQHYSDGNASSFNKYLSEKYLNLVRRLRIAGCPIELIEPIQPLFAMNYPSEFTAASAFQCTYSRAGMGQW